MSIGSFGENFPYSNFHDLNMDWVIKIAKDFLDQYSTIQTTLSEGLTELDDKATELENALQSWYDTHSEDIANQLASALRDLNAWYTEHQGDLSAELTQALADFNTRATVIATQVIGDIPQDYTELTAQVDTLFDVSDFDEYLQDDCSAILQWNSTYGYVSLNATSLVIRPGKLFPFDTMVNTSHFPRYYNARIRVFTTNSYTPENFVSYTDTHKHLVKMPKDTYWVLEISKLGNQACTLDDAKYLEFYPAYTTDKTLTLENMSADALTIGDIVNTAFNAIYQYLDAETWENHTYWNWFNNQMTKGEVSGDFATYPPIFLKQGVYTFNINPQPTSFTWLDINGTVSALSANTSLNSDGTYSFTVPATGATLYITLSNFSTLPYSTYMLVNSKVIPTSLQNGIFSATPSWLNPDGMTIYTVGKGGQFDTISGACAKASAGDIIFVLPGVYDEDVSIWGKKLHIVGFNKALCKLVNHTANYDTPPLEMNIGSLSNMTLIADGTNPDSDMPIGKDHTQYCLHIESGVNANGEIFDIFNCDFINEFHACIGCGLYQGLTVRFRYCTFRSNGYNGNYPRGTFYYHSNTGEATAQKMIVEHCVISGAYQEVIHAGAPGTASGMCSSRFNNNTVNSDATSDETLMVYNEFWKPHFKLDIMSANNTVKILNSANATDGYSTTLEGILDQSYQTITVAYNKMIPNRAYIYSAYTDSTNYAVGYILYYENDVKVVELSNYGCNVTCASNGTIYVWNRSGSTNTFKFNIREI